MAEERKQQPLSSQPPRPPEIKREAAAPPAYPEHDVIDAKEHGSGTAPAEAIAHPLHDMPVSKEHNIEGLLTLFQHADLSQAKHGYDGLFCLLQNKKLPTAAIYRFANHCYRYWQQLLLSREEAGNTEREVISRGGEIDQVLAAIQEQAPDQLDIAYYGVVDLLFRKGYLIPITDSPLTCQPCVAALLGRMAWRQWLSPSQPTTPFDQAVFTLRNQMEPHLLQQAYGELLRFAISSHEKIVLDQSTAATFAELAATVRHFLRLLDTQGSCLAFSQRRAFINQLIDQLGDQYFTVLQHWFEEVCNIRKPPTNQWSLTEGTAFIVQLIHTWHHYEKTPLAVSQLERYKKLLKEKHRQLSEKLPNYDNNPNGKARITVLLSELDDCIIACAEAAIPLTKTLLAPPPTPLPASHWAARADILRDWYKDTTQAIQDIKPQEMFHHNTDTAQKLIHHSANEIESQLGSAPCAFALMGGGSYSRGETSFASDIDFFLVIADATYKQHPYFAHLLDLLVFKAASFPRGVLPLEAKELHAMRQGECWVGTPADLIAENCFLPQSDRGKACDFARAFPPRWPRLLYISTHQAPAARKVWEEYQKRLSDFFQQQQNGVPYYRLIEPWTLEKHLETHVRSRVIAAHQSDESKSTVATLETVNLKNIAYPLYNAVLCYGRFTGLTDCMDTHTILERLLATDSFLPKPFLERLRGAVHDLQTWRLRKHWDALHHPDFANLHEDEVWLWPKDTAQQAEWVKPPRGFYLDAAETDRCQSIRLLVEEVIIRSVQGFKIFAERLPALAVLPPSTSSSSTTTISEHIDKLPSLSSSYTTTSVPEVKETKREVSEEEAQAIVAAQSHAVPETKSAASSSVAHVFNPLAAAVGWTLEQLAKPKPKDDKDSAQIDHASRTAHVQWLAQVMGHCAEELPAGEPHSNDPICVKQDAEFRKHWQVYWTIPTAWRDMYIKQLRRSLTTKPDVIEPLANAPNKVGWRLSTQLGEQQWQQALRPLFAAEPQASLPPEAKTEIAEGKAIWVSWVEQGTIRWAPLRQECAKVVIDAKQQRWQPQHNVHGNHRLYALQTPSHPFWVKAYPEQPGTEYLVTALDRRLGVNGTPAQQLMALHHAPLRVPDGTPQGMQIQQSAILLSQHVADAKYTLHRRIKKEPQFLEKLDFLAFAKTLLRVLLTNPEDDKGSDYFLVPLPGRDKYQLIRIDNERAFLPVTHLTQSAWSSQEDLQVKSILYCLDQMLLPWSSDPRTAALLDDLHQIQPSALIIDLLQDIEQQHTHWQQLLPESSIIQHASLQDPWMSIPTFMLPEGLESALLKRFTSLQTALRLLKPQAITGLKLLELVQPKLARYYNQSLFKGKLARDPKFPQANVQARFDHVAGRYYQPQRSVKSATTASSLDHQTSVASGPAVLSRQLSAAFWYHFTAALSSLTTPWPFS